MSSYVVSRWIGTNSRASELRGRRPNTTAHGRSAACWKEVRVRCRDDRRCARRAVVTCWREHALARRPSSNCVP